MRGLSLSRPHPRRVRHARHPCPHTFWQSYAHRRPTTVTPHEPTRHAAARVLDIARRPRRHVPRAHPRKQPTPPTQHTQARHALAREPAFLHRRQTGAQCAVQLQGRARHVSGTRAVKRLPVPPRPQPRQRQPQPRPHPQHLRRRHNHGRAIPARAARRRLMRDSSNVPVSFHARSVTEPRSRRRRLLNDAAERRFQDLGAWKQFQQSQTSPPAASPGLVSQSTSGTRTKRTDLEETEPDNRARHPPSLRPEPPGQARGNGLCRRLGKRKV